MIKMLYLHILQELGCILQIDCSRQLQNLKEIQKSVLRYIENITGSVGNFVVYKNSDHFDI